MKYIYSVNNKTVIVSFSYLVFISYFTLTYGPKKPNKPNSLGPKYVSHAYSSGIILREKKESEKREGRYSIEEAIVLSCTALDRIAGT